MPWIASGKRRCWFLGQTAEGRAGSRTRVLCRQKLASRTREMEVAAALAAAVAVDLFG
jgi:hypothetical protein